MFLVSQIDSNRSIKSFSCANGIFSKPTPAESLFNHRPTALGFASAATTLKSGFVCKHFNIPAAPGAPAPVIKTLMPPAPLKGELAKFSISAVINWNSDKRILSKKCYSSFFAIQLIFKLQRRRRNKLSYSQAIPFFINGFYSCIIGNNDIRPVAVKIIELFCFSCSIKTHAREIIAGFWPLVSGLWLFVACILSLVPCALHLVACA